MFVLYEYIISSSLGQVLEKIPNFSLLSANEWLVARKLIKKFTKILSDYSKIYVITQ